MRRNRKCILLVSLLLIVGLLTGCQTTIDKSQDYINNHQPSGGTPMVTVNIFVPSDGTVSDAAVAAMAEQFNEITEEKYNTHVVFHLVDSKTYSNYITNKFGSVESAIESGTPTSAQPTTETGEDGVVRELYPVETEAQLDIFVINGLSMLTNFVNDGRVMDISDLAASKYYRDLCSPANESSISESIFWNSALAVHTCGNDGCTSVWGDEIPDYCPTSVKAENEKAAKDETYTVNYKPFAPVDEQLYYGVPSNFLIGNYEYLIVSREKAVQYGFIGYLYIEASENITAAEARVSAAQTAFDAVKGDSGHADYATLKAALEEKQAILSEAREILATVEADQIPEFIRYEENKAVLTNALKSMIQSAGLNAKDFHSTVRGDYRTRYTYTDTHHVTVVKAPTVTTEEIYTGMYCISSTCANPERAMEILVELNTNRDLHTIFQYGAEGVHFEKVQDDDGNTVIQIIENPTSTYTMDPRYSGNVACLYACPELGFDAEYAHYLFLQNKDAVKG